MNLTLNIKLSHFYRIITMYKKILYCSYFLFLGLVNNATGNAPGAEEWKDSFGRLAPPRVRAAADELWAAASIEGHAAHAEGFGYFRNPDCSAKEVCCTTMFCGLILCCKAGDIIKQGEQPRQHALRPYDFDMSHSIATSNAEKALRNFKEVVNSSVVSPENYSGDASICDLGPWVMDDNGWVRKGEYFFHKIDSGIRVSSKTVKKVLEFVNSHKGWAVSDVNTNQPAYHGSQVSPSQSSGSVQPSYGSTDYKLMK